MIEIRKDYILNRYTYITSQREKRPKEFKKNKTNKKNSTCFFCVGNENLTPREIGRIGDKQSWQVRWFANKFPIVKQNSINKISTKSDKYFTSGEGFGYHEIIVETSDHNRQLADLSVNEIKEVLKVYSLRIRELSKKEGIKYAQLFKNSGEEAGTSIAHTHTQIVATNIIPKLVQEKVEATKKYKKCPYCDIIKKEEKSKRLIFSDDNFIAFAPFAPRFNFEVWIFPKKHYKNIIKLNDKELESLAISFERILSKLAKWNISYNFYLHYSPKKENLHFHFEITPRLNKWAGFELATDSYVITTFPEDVAKFYQER